MSREDLDVRVEERVDRMWRQGFVDEVRALEGEGLRQGLTASRALGYSQVLSFLTGECTEAEAREETVRATRRFVRRQESWFNRQRAGNAYTLTLTARKLMRVAFDHIKSNPNHQ